MVVGEQTSLIPLGQAGKHKYFFEWKDYKMIQTDLKVICSLKDALTATLNATEAVSFKEYLEKRSSDLEKLNTTNLREILEETQELVWEDYKPNFLGLGQSKKKVFEILNYVSIVSTILSVVLVVGLCFFKRIKSLNSTTKIIYEELHRQKRQKQARKRQRYTEEERIYDIPRIIDEISMKNFPQAQHILTIIPENVKPEQPTKPKGRKLNKPFFGKGKQTANTKSNMAIQTDNVSHMVTDTSSTEEETYTSYPSPSMSTSMAYLIHGHICHI